MALTITRTGDWMMSFGDRSATKVTLAFGNPYTSGGESLTATDLGLSQVDIVDIQPKGGYLFSYDYANKKVLVHVEEAVAAGGPLPEAAGDLSTLTGVVVHAIGR